MKRSRPALGWGAAAFALLQLGMTVGIEFFWPELRDPDYGYRFQHLAARTVRAEPRPITMMMIGSSCTGYGFEGSLVEHRIGQKFGRPVVAFNMGVRGAGPVRQLICLNRVLASGIKPDLLMIEVMPLFMQSPGPSPIEVGWLPITRLRHDELELVERYGKSAGPHGGDWWNAFLLPWFEHRFTIVSRFSPKLLPFSLQDDWGKGADQCGWIALKRFQVQTSVQPGPLELPAWAGDLKHFTLNDAACRAQRELLDLCRNEHIPAVLVLMPVSSNLRGLYRATAATTMNDFLNDLSATYGTPIVNAQDWVPDTGFADSQHLLTEGAEVFTERLAREVLLSSPSLPSVPAVNRIHAGSRSEGLVEPVGR